jgi:hypothetical protein
MPEAACLEFSHAIPEEWMAPCSMRFGRPGKRAGFRTNQGVIAAMFRLAARSGALLTSRAEACFPAGSR